VTKPHPGLVNTGQGKGGSAAGLQPALDFGRWRGASRYVNAPGISSPP